MTKYEEMKIKASIFNSIISNRGAILVGESMVKKVNEVFDIMYHHELEQDPKTMGVK